MVEASTNGPPWKTEIRPQDTSVQVRIVPRLHLLFCPYLPMSDPVVFSHWELGPLESFENRWMDPRFKAQATAFLGKFVGTNGKPIENPTLLCRKGRQLDGQQPSLNEVKALQLSLVFSSIDRNPRRSPENMHDGWMMVTSENAELHVWPIDLEEGYVAKSTGLLVNVNMFGHKVDDPRLVMSPPLDLHMPIGIGAPDPLLLEGVFETTLKSYGSPGSDNTADKVRVAVEWLVRAWHNTATVQYPERIVFLKTAFEAVTGTNRTHKSAKTLRKIFEGTSATAYDSKVLVWSPDEKAIRTHTWVDRSNRPRTRAVTDLEHWFMEFGKVRNTIIHDHQLPRLEYSISDTAYSGHFFFTAEFLLRGVIKVLLAKCGYADSWRSDAWRGIRAILEKEDAGSAE